MVQSLGEITFPTPSPSFSPGRSPQELGVWGAGELNHQSQSPIKKTCQPISGRNILAYKIKKALTKVKAFCRSGPTRTGDRLHPMQEIYIYNFFTYPYYSLHLQLFSTY
jgi:hypothetical protein